MMEASWASAASSATRNSSSSLSSRSLPLVLKKVALASSNAVVGADDDLHVALGAQPDLVDGDDVEGVGHRQHQRAVLLHLEREDAPVHHEVAREQRERLGREVHLVEVRDLQAQLRRQGLDEVLLRDEALADEHVPQSPPLDLLSGESGLDLVLVDQAVGDEQGAEPATAGGDLRHGGDVETRFHATRAFLPRGAARPDGGSSL